VNKVFPEAEFANWQQCQRLLRCAQTSTEWILKRNFTFEKAAHLLSETASYLHEKGQYAQARPLYEQALAICEEILGKEHPEVA